MGGGGGGDSSDSTMNLKMYTTIQRPYIRHEGIQQEEVQLKTASGLLRNLAVLPPATH